MKKWDCSILGSKCCKVCGKHLKQNLIERNPEADRCYTCRNIKRGKVLPFTILSFVNGEDEAERFIYLDVRIELSIDFNKTIIPSETAIYDLEATGKYILEKYGKGMNKFYIIKFHDKNDKFFGGFQIDYEGHPITSIGNWVSNMIVQYYHQG